MKTFGRTTLGLVGALAIALLPTLVFGDDAAAAAPTPNKGDTAWMLTSTALVLLMSVPALGLFYGGLVRSKNMLSVLMQVFVGFSLVTVLWCVYGYSLTFTGGSPFFGGFTRLFLNGTFDSATGAYSYAATFSKGTPMYELVYVAFQATFAAITCCLILGSIVERIKFSGVLLFIVLWFTFSYIPVAHMVWFWDGPDAYTTAAAADVANTHAGYIWQMGALDFAGGTVVHINAGVAGLVGAFVLGKRIGYGKEAMSPHSLTMTMIGASLLWFGWFGFNAGSALEANGSAALAFMNTYLATACAVISWMLVEWIVKGKPSMLGAASGAVAGLVAITPAAGNVGIPGAFVIGLGVEHHLLLGMHGPKEDHRRRRLARRVRSPRSRRYLRSANDGHLQRAELGRSGLRRLGHGNAGLHLDRRSVHDPSKGRRDRVRLDGGRRVHLLPDREVHRWTARVGGGGARRPRHHGSRRARVHGLVPLQPIFLAHLRPATFTGCRPFLLARACAGCGVR